MIDQQDYYAFGMTFQQPLPGQLKNRYLFNGKELSNDFGLGVYDFHVRMYDPAIGRTLNTDPANEEFYNFSPYSWVFNNPIRFVDPTGARPTDEWQFNKDTRDLTWISDKGGKDRQYVNVVNSEGEQLGQGSVAGSEVYAYSLRGTVAITNFNVGLDDQNYNRRSGYEYSMRDFRLRIGYMKENTPIKRFLEVSEKNGNARPISSIDEDLYYGHLTSRLKMMGFAIETVSLLANPTDGLPGSKFSLSSSRYYNQGGRVNGSSKDINSATSGGSSYSSSLSVTSKGSTGRSALTGSNSWNNFLRANVGRYSGSGWQQRAAMDYRSSSFYTPK